MSFAGWEQQEARRLNESAAGKAEGAVHMFYEAEEATSYQVWHKGPGETGLTQVTTTIPGEYLAFGLPAGLHTYKVAAVGQS